MHSAFHDYEAHRDLSFEFILHRDHCTLNHLAVSLEHFFHLGGGESVSCSVDDVVQSTHHVQVPVLVEVPGVPRDVVAGRLGHVLV